MNTQHDDITMEHVLSNPHAYGLPTMQEYMSNPDKYRKLFAGRTEDSVLAGVDKSTLMFKNILKKQKYFFEGVVCKNLEQLQRVASGEGVDLVKCKIEPQAVREAGGAWILYVNFRRPLANELGLIL